MKTFKHNTKKSLSLLLICLLTAALLLTGCGAPAMTRIPAALMVKT